MSQDEDGAGDEVISGKWPSRCLISRLWLLAAECRLDASRIMRRPVFACCEREERASSASAARLSLARRPDGISRRANVLCGHFFLTIVFIENRNAFDSIRFSRQEMETLTTDKIEEIVWHAQLIDN